MRQTVKRTLDIGQMQRIETEILRTIDRICGEQHLRYYLVCGSVLGAVRHGGPIPWDYDVDITVPYPELPEFCEVMKRELADTEYCIYIPGETDLPENVTTFPRIAPRNIDPRRMHIDVFPQIGITADAGEQRELVKALTDVKTKYRDKRLAGVKPSGRWKSKVRYLWLQLKTRSYDAEELLREFQSLCAKYDYRESEYVTNPCGHYGLKNIVPKAWFGEGRRVPYQDMMLPVPARTEEYLRHYYGDYTRFPPEDVIERGLGLTITVEENFNGQTL